MSDASKIPTVVVEANESSCYTRNDTEDGRVCTILIVVLDLTLTAVAQLSARASISSVSQAKA